MFDAPAPLTEIHRFFQDNAEAAQNASLLLGGRPWLRRVQRLINDLALPVPVTRRNRIEIKKLHKLLTLQYVTDFDSPEASYFDLLDPAGPEIEEICLLTEALANAASASGIELTEAYAEVEFCDDVLGAYSR
jgi:hypothetical protein